MSHLIETKVVQTGVHDDGTVIRRLQSDLPSTASALMARISAGTHQLLVACVPIEDDVFDANLAAVKLRGADGPLAAQMRTAGLDDALAELAAREG